MGHEDDRRAGQSSPARHLSPEEVSVILRRASLVETASGLPAPLDPTVEDLVEAAREVGMDPALVRRAAAVSPVPETGLAGALLGADGRIRLRAHLSAAMPEARDALVRASEDALESSGRVTDSDPALFVWEGSRTLSRDRVTIRKEGDALLVDVDSDRTGRYLLFWGISFLTLGVVSGAVGGLATLGAVSPLLLFVAPALLPVLVARPFWKRAQRRAARHLELFAMELARLVEEDPATLRGDGVDEAPEA